MKFICGIDTGGTFTDCYVQDDKGQARTYKAFTTPHDYAEGVFASLSGAAGLCGKGLRELLEGTSRFVVGTTVGTNAFLERKGARVGLLVTRGFADTLHIMRGVGRVTGVDPDATMAMETTAKPAPIIAKDDIREVDERVDASGRILQAPMRAAVLAAAEDLRRQGVTSIAIGYLWAFKNPRNEAVTKAWITEAWPDAFVSCSHEIAPKIGEYERFAATAINAYIGPVVTDYVGRVRRILRENGFSRPILVMECNGGVINEEIIENYPVLTLNSGPAGGVSGSLALARQLNIPNVITTDVGGTSFDVGLVVSGQLALTAISQIGQFEYYVPSIDVQTIGSGGGSVAHVDPVRRVISVGPESAGAFPGPVCYEQGGTRPTLTDADVVLGYISPDDFLGGRKRLNRDAAYASLRELGEPLGLTPEETAAGIAQISESQMADLVRRVVISRGHDPRDFVLFAYGGAGPVHAAAYGGQLGVKALIVPGGDTAAVWSAFGVATSDVKNTYEYASVFREPFDITEINKIFATLEERASADIGRSTDQGHIQYVRELGMRYSTQLHEVYVPVAEYPVTEESALDLIAAFEQAYGKIYGEEAGFREAGIEIVDFRVVGFVPADVPAPARIQGAMAANAVKGRRQVWFSGAYVEALIYSGAHLPPHQAVAGPAIVELATTAIVVPPKFTVTRDEWNNFTVQTMSGLSDGVTTAHV